MLGLCRYAWAFCSRREWGLLSSCGLKAYRCGGFSCCGEWPLGAWVSVVAARGLSNWHGLQVSEHSLNSCGPEAYGIFWDQGLKRCSLLCKADS